MHPDVIHRVDMATMVANSGKTHRVWPNNVNTEPKTNRAECVAPTVEELMVAKRKAHN